MPYQLFNSLNLCLENFFKVSSINVSRFHLFLLFLNRIFLPKKPWYLSSQLSTMIVKPRINQLLLFLSHFFPLTGTKRKFVTQLIINANLHSYYEYEILIQIFFFIFTSLSVLQPHKKLKQSTCRSWTTLFLFHETYLQVVPAGESKQMRFFSPQNSIWTSTKKVKKKRKWKLKRKQLGRKLWYLEHSCFFYA